MKLLIIGAGGHGKCCLDIARAMKKYDEICFLDDKQMGQTVNDAKVIGVIQDAENFEQKEYEIFVAIGNNRFRKELSERLIEKGYKITTLISPNCVISDYAVISQGTVIYPGVMIEADVVLGKGCIITSSATVNHDAAVGDYSLIYSNTVVRPNVTVGELVRVGSGCILTFGSVIDEGVDIPDGTIVK